MAKFEISELQKSLKEIDNSYLFVATNCGFYHLSTVKGFVSNVALALVLENGFSLLGVDLEDNYLLFIRNEKES